MKKLPNLFNQWVNGLLVLCLLGAAVFVSSATGRAAPDLPEGGGASGSLPLLEDAWYFGAAGLDTPAAIVTDSDLHVYVGSAADAAWGSPVRAYTRYDDGYVASVSTITGALQWLTFLGGEGYDRVTALALTGGNLYVAGVSSMSWGSPQTALAGGTDTFIARLDPSDGSLTWMTFVGGAGNDDNESMVLSGTSLYLNGSSSLSWGSPVRAFGGGSHDVYAFKLSLVSGLPVWNTFLGGADADIGGSVAVNASGLAVGGYSYAGWGAPVRTFSSDVDAFAAMLNPTTGALQWHSFLGGPQADYGGLVGLDSAGNVYVSGDSNASWGSPLRSFADDWDVFAARLNSSGALSWNTFLGGAGYDRRGSGALSVAASGLVVVGSSSMTWGQPVDDFVAADPQRSMMGANAFAAQLTSSGALAWSTFAGGVGDDGGVQAVLGGSDCVYFVAQSNAAWGTPARAFAGGYDTAVTRLCPAGFRQWNTFLGASGSDAGIATALGPDGSRYAAGATTGYWENAVYPAQTAGGGNDGFVAKWNAAGSMLWQTFVGGSGYDSINAISVDGSGHVFVAGFSSASWGAPVRAHQGGYDGFVAELNAFNGTLLWNTFLGGGGADMIGGLARIGTTTYVTGESTAGWGTPVRTFKGGGWDAFAAAVDSGGGLLWNTFLGGTADDEGMGIVADNAGYIYVAGDSGAAWTNAAALEPAAAEPDSGAAPAGDVSQPPLLPSALEAPDAGTDVFVTRLSAGSGGIQWLTFIGGAGGEFAKGIAIDPGVIPVEGGGGAGLYVVGDSSAGWGTPLRAHSGGFDAFVMRVAASNGDQQWLTFLGSSGNDSGKSILTARNGDVFVAGGSPMSWGSPSRAYSGGSDGFIVGLSATGVMNWQVFLGGIGADVLYGMSTDGIRLYIGGASDVAWDYAWQPTGGYDATLIKLNVGRKVYLPVTRR